MAGVSRSVRRPASKGGTGDFPRVTVPNVKPDEVDRLRKHQEHHKWWKGIGQLFGPVAEARGPIYRNTVSHKVKAKRRTKNKAARKARRLNRG